MTDELIEFVSQMCYKYNMTMRDMIETTEVIELLKQIKEKIKNGTRNYA